MEELRIDPVSWRAARGLTSRPSTSGHRVVDDVVEDLSRRGSVYRGHLGQDAMVRWDPDNPFDDRLHEYGPHITQPGYCLCRLDVEATTGRLHCERDAERPLGAPVAFV
jgi:hypothetical protein